LLDQERAAPVGLNTEDLTDKTPIDLKDQGRKLAEEHRDQNHNLFNERVGANRPGHIAPARAALLQRRFPLLNKILNEAIDRLQGQSSILEQGSSGVEWLLDNHYIASFALREVQEDLPSQYERQLPQLKSGHPRIYNLAFQIVNAENLLFDMDHVERFVEGYQEVLPLSVGELWALPTMLRFSILECLVDAVARLTGLAESTTLELADKPPLSGHLDDALVIENSIRSLRTLSNFDWKHFFESLSLVDSILRQDPAGLYIGVDFETRDRYRKVIEDLASYGQMEITHLAGMGSDHSPKNISDITYSVKDDLSWKKKPATPRTVDCGSCASSTTIPHSSI
jgi:hypothetical protein